MSFNKLNNITGWIVFFIATLVYWLTVEETASFWDCGEFIAVSYKLMVPHPPGAPLFLLLGRMFSFLALGDVLRVAYWINILSVLSSAFTILFLFWTITLLCLKMLGVNPKTVSLPQRIGVMAAGVVGSLAYTFSDSFWFSAVEAEVYAMSSFFTAFVVWAMLKWDQVEDAALENRWLILIAYMMGLSIGVHLLNLVTIPALALIYYFKKHPKVDLKGIVASLIIGGVIIVIVMYGVIPGLPSLAGRIEILFVNTFRLPFGSGIIFFVALFLAGLVYGIRYSIQKDKILLNTALLCFTFILIGYSSYALIVIRSNANPPINENAPKDIISFVSYLKREQYGDRPLIFGRTFMSERIGAERGEALYRKGKDRYEVYDYRNTYQYSDQTLLPRMYSTSDDHAQLYREWTGLREGERPTFFDNLYYMFRYQIGHMYFRYFLWNFAGRDGDDKDASWLLPWADTDVPEEIAMNKARDNFYMLPLILGVIGLFFQLRTDEKNFGMVAMLFFLTGAALVIYMNSPPVEPRERDYIYVGSFYAFAMWIGFGVLAVSEWIQKVIKSAVASPIAAGAICMIVPVLMGAKGWDNHNRSNRFHSVDQARNTLASCAPNAILFTGGDNDTFPLWYVQDVEGFRTDVRVIVLSYFNTDWYIDQMRRQVYESEPLPFSLEYDNYKSGTNDFVPYVENPAVKGPINLVNFLRLVKEGNPAIQVALQGGGSTSATPSKTFVVPVDSSAVASMGIAPKGREHRTARQMNISMRQGSGALYKSDLMILDLIASNEWKRPIYFNNTSANTIALELREWLFMEGLTYRLLPVRAENRGDLGEVNTAVMYENIKKFAFRGFEDPKVYHDEEYKKFGANTRNAFYRLALQFYLENDKEKAKEVLDLGLEQIPDFSIPYDYYTPRYVKLYYFLGETEKANQLSEIIGGRAVENLNYIVANDLNTIGYSGLKDRSLITLSQLRELYKDAAEREENRIMLLETSPVITGEAQQKDIEEARQKRKFYADRFSFFDEQFNSFYQKLYRF